MVNYIVILVVVLIVALIAYAAFLFWAFQNKRFIFSPYMPPPLQNGFQPGGNVVSLSPKEQECRKQVLLGQGLPDPSCFTTTNQNNMNNQNNT